MASPFSFPPVLSAMASYTLSLTTRSGQLNLLGHLRQPPSSGVSFQPGRRRRCFQSLRITRPNHPPLAHPSSCAGCGHNNGNGNGGQGGDDGDAEDADNGERDNGEALLVLAQAGRKLDSLPSDLAAAVEGGFVTGDMVRHFMEMEGSPVLRWLLQFQGFKERLLADDLFLAKLFVECGVGVIAKTTAEYERRRDNFFKEINTALSDVVMATVANVMLAYLPAPTICLQPPLATNAGLITSFLHNCPDTAIQIAFIGRSYLFLQRLGAIGGTVVASLQGNGPKLFSVGTDASSVGTSVTNALTKARKDVDRELDDGVVDIPVVTTVAEMLNTSPWTTMWYFGARAEVSAEITSPDTAANGRASAISQFHSSGRF